MWTFVGLGNPGSRYDGTRHNVGFRVVDELARRWGVSLSRGRQDALQASGRWRDEKFLLLCPQTYMNRSGGPMQAALRWHKAPLSQAVVIHDDLDLSFGSLRVKRGGGHGGHNGLRDIHRHLGEDYLRLRMGIGRPPARWEVSDYVLARWTEEEQAKLDAWTQLAVEALESLISRGLEATMNQFNVKKRGRKARSTPSDSPNPA